MQCMGDVYTLLLMLIKLTLVISHFQMSTDLVLCNMHSFDAHLKKSV